ncbi:hypothetical protein AB8878_07325 [Alphaproteobacteria bacterium LSUCC0226]
MLWVISVRLGSVSHNTAEQRKQSPDHQQLNLLFQIVSFHRKNPATKKGQRKGWPSLGRNELSSSFMLHPYYDGFMAGLGCLCVFDQLERLKVVPKVVLKTTNWRLSA